ncbi:response regulator [Oscillospiraceae bacterium 42-9]|uniref:response regulator transcription factor n=1 Tax=Acutalibacter sp. TaxID=1918636 RepID=UPI00216C66C6|nr:response regulator [Acutalibacter sp.]
MWKTVMIDDEPWALEGLAEIIDWQAAGFSIQGRFTDPQEAFAFLCESWPDVVFTDIRMPGLSGVDLISMARQKGIDCEFVLISAYEDFKAAQQAILLDVCGYVLKPYDSEEIHKVAEILQRHLEKRRGAPQLDWREPPELTRRKAASWQEKLPCYSGGFFCLHEEPDQRLRPWEGVERLPVSVKGAGSGFLVLSNDARAARAAFLDQPGSEGWGVSQPHALAEEALPVMLREAWYSLRCRFQYSVKDLVGDIQLYLCENMGKELVLGQIAQRYHFSEPYFCVLFKRGSGVSVMRFIQLVRVHYAAYLIRTTTKRLQDISEEVGFNNYSYFGKLFKKYQGVTPESCRE